MAKYNLGSINYTKLKEAAEKRHSAFSRSKDGKTVYVNIVQWLNDEPDKYGNTSSIQLNSTKEMKDKEDKIYIGNMKSSIEQSNNQSNSSSSNISTTEDDLPF